MDWSALGDLLRNLLSPDFWKRVLVGVSGVGLMIVGLTVMLSQSKSSREIAAVAVKAAPVV